MMCFLSISVILREQQINCISYSIVWHSCLFWIILFIFSTRLSTKSKYLQKTSVQNHRPLYQNNTLFKFHTLGNLLELQNNEHWSHQHIYINTTAKICSSQKLVYFFQLLLIMMLSQSSICMALYKCMKLVSLLFCSWDTQVKIKSLTIIVKTTGLPSNWAKTDWIAGNTENNTEYTNWQQVPCCHTYIFFCFLMMHFLSISVILHEQQINCLSYSIVWLSFLF